MNKIFKFQKIIILSSIVVSLLFATSPLFAQETSCGSWRMPLPWEIQHYSLKTTPVPGLSNVDPRAITASKLNIFIGLLGFVAMILIIYGIFRWTTDKDNKDKLKIAKKKIFSGFVLLILAIIFHILASFVLSAVFRKPVIYLYPEQKQEITVELNYQGEIIADYPKYDKEIGGWEVIAYPNGKIINHADNLEYSYLFWEGKSKSSIDWNLSSGFVVAGENTRDFLQETLAKIGLTPKEYNEFIVYWYPLMMNNRYNLIHFAGKQYTDTAPLKITPEPDSMLRVFMVYKPLSKNIDIEPQIITPFERKGFTVVEWGGTEVK